MNRPAGKKPTRHLKAAIAVASAGVFAATAVAAAGADGTVESQDQPATISTSTTGDSTVAGQVAVGMTDTPARPIVIVPFPNARTRAS